MHARAVDAAAVRLRELRHQQREGLALGALALALAVAATEVRPDLAGPLFLGGLAVGAIGVKALWRRWDLLERLAPRPAAYVIPEVLHQALREATTERRRSFAALIRLRLSGPGTAFQARVSRVADELEGLAAELDDPRLALDPACAVACMRLLSDTARSPLLNPELPPEELGWRVRQIRSGFAGRIAA